MSNEKQSLGLGFVRRFDLDVTIRAMLAYGEFIGQCMDDARAEEREACARAADLYTTRAAKYYNTTSIAEIIAAAIRSRDS